MSKHIGSTMRSLFDELGETDELELLSRKKVLADQLRDRMEHTHVTHAMLAKAMKTSRTVVHRLLDPTEKGVTLDTLVRASSALGLELEVSFRAKGSPKKAVVPSARKSVRGAPRREAPLAKASRKGARASA